MARKTTIYVVLFAATVAVAAIALLLWLGAQRAPLAARLLPEADAIVYLDLRPMRLAATFAQTPQATPPPPSAPRSVQFPKPVEKTLANGLRVVVIQRSLLPLVSAQLLIKSGGEVDPSDLSGVADMTATLLTRGTATRSATQIAEAIEALGGSLNSSAGWDASSATTGVMSARFGSALEILSDVVRNPSFK